ncbi:MAG: hypothetical protein A3D74_01845 [Candidatus Levybacteria bacterium RIFCSPHIGHO2_02_FULL_37_13]|nr:MAG: hypothetical protein A3D74_01845 [Candidatus Levybacteria bacterium RIFCSPHIGHO2_02_FULL_37_13]OGH39442.1 MAG: hypothetical protein A3B41_00905 [Candidatus Levybacteria bacterium RIFCSPLOWO2_01_FULL_37_26]
MKNKSYNNISGHPLQSKEWAEFRKKMGVKIIEENGLIFSIHKTPHLPWTIGYLPKGPMPTLEMLDKLREIGKEEKCIFIQLEPNVQYSSHPEFISGSPAIRQVSLQTNEMLKLVQHDNFKPAAHPLFTKYTFILDLTKSEEELLKSMHPKTRYNIRVAQKHNVKVIGDNSDEAFEAYIKLTHETTKRQGFYAHTEQYHRTMWKTLRHKNSKFEYRNSKQIQNTNDKKFNTFEHSNLGHSNIVSDFGFRISDLNHLTPHLLTAKYQDKTLVAWILFVYKDTLYYPYGASSSQHRETMASNLMMWEAIKFGKKLGLKRFDMWGALGKNPDPKDPWYGFHRFKQGYGPELVEFIGSYDLVINPILYQLYKIADKIRWIILKTIKRTA